MTIRLGELCDVVPFTREKPFTREHALFCTVFFRITVCFHQDLIIQAGRVLHSPGRGHAVWLCTESPPKNGQGSHAVRRVGLMMDLLLASPPMDHKYGCDLNRFISQHNPPSYPPSGLKTPIPVTRPITSLCSMASVPPPKDAPSEYDEAERGTQDVHSGPTTISAPGLIDEKVVDEGKVKSPAVISSEVIPVSNAAPSKPPAKKVSRWTLWTLWFNTYRSVFDHVVWPASRVSDFASGLTH